MKVVKLLIGSALLTSSGVKAEPPAVEITTTTTTELPTSLDGALGASIVGASLVTLCIIVLN
jgi:hypothetical protein